MDRRLGRRRDEAARLNWRMKLAERERFDNRTCQRDIRSPRARITQPQRSALRSVAMTDMRATSSRVKRVVSVYEAVCGM